MKNSFQYSNLVLTTAAIALNLAVSSPQAMAFSLTWNLNNAEFQDSTSATGSFEYDADATTYSEVNVTTTANNPFTGRTYTTSDILSSNANSLVLEAGDETLTLVFGNPLTNSGGTVPLVDTISKEEFESTTNFGSRKFIAGDVSTLASVPFEFSPTLGIITCLCLFGIPMVKNKLN